MSVLLHQYLDIDYRIYSEGQSNQFVLECGVKRLTINNHFFFSDNIGELYTEDHLPARVQTDTLLIDEEKLPISLLYGTNDITCTSEGFVYDGDLISSSFFMLSRWEESLPGPRDVHGRFSASQSIAHKYGILGRPIVNEYVEVLWKLLQMIGYDGDRKKYTYTCVPTHDVDHPQLWPFKLSKAKSLAANIVKGRIGELQRVIKASSTGNDPWDTFSMLMDKAEEVGVRSNFFFMAGGSHPHDGDYKLSDPAVTRLISAIESRGHNIGLHPSYLTMNNEELLVEEKERLQKATSQKVESGRQHYLRCQVPTTWSIWNNADMEWDSTMGYADLSGFRCGTCYPYPVFDIKNRVTLALVERPLVVMDVTLRQYEGLSATQACSKIGQLQREVKKYEGEFVFLWHNSSFLTEEWINYEIVWRACYN